ncbi:hypothetical protein [Rhodococcus sp. SORGH_AS_0303]|uniref:hypothetical protein n=1 Tax=Rhodococcus sp. SORGH_AS_0303 TaxID=3041753 RepID=UPI002788634A|nr:hypothetical protein [Rhodococcus sp. SORGH_AS_0303]MDQ1202724.1 hypothetical protein [Rhodococcus sp. SORGH_AS_0303]
MVNIEFDYAVEDEPFYVEEQHDIASSGYYIIIAIEWRAVPSGLNSNLDYPPEFGQLGHRRDERGPSVFTEFHDIVCLGLVARFGGTCSPPNASRPYVMLPVNPDDVPGSLAGIMPAAIEAREDFYRAAEWVIESQGHLWDVYGDDRPDPVA